MKKETRANTKGRIRSSRIRLVRDGASWLSSIKKDTVIVSGTTVVAFSRRLTQSVLGAAFSSTPLGPMLGRIFVYLFPSLENGSVKGTNGLPKFRKRLMVIARENLLGYFL